MAYAMTFKPDFLERCKRMSGLKSNAAFAGAIGVSESVLSKAMHTNIVSPTMIVGFNRAFGFTPGEIAEVTEIPDKDLEKVYMGGHAFLRPFISCPPPESCSGGG